MHGKAVKYLEEKGIKPSVQRIAIMEYLLSHRTHPTVDMIFNDLSPSYPTLSKTTVYNTLKLFIDCGLVNELFLERGESRFDGDISVHSHFICRDCGKVFDFFPKKDKIGDFISGNLPKEKFTVNSFQITVSGSCGCKS